MRYVHGRSIEEQLERSGLIDELRKRAEAIAEEIRRDAPVDAKQVEYEPGELTTDEIASRYSNVWDD